MKRFRAAAAVVATALVAQAVAVAASGTPPKVETKTFAPKDGGFSAAFPSKPESKDQKLDLEDGTTTTLKCFILESAKKGEVLMVAYVDTPDDLEGTDEEKLENGVKGFASAAGAGEPTSKQVVLNGHLGREFECEVEGKGKFRGRMYIAGKRLFQVVAAGSEEYVSGDAVNAFFKSFKLTVPAGDHKD